MVYEKAKEVLTKIEEAQAILAALMGQLTEGILLTSVGSWGDHILPELEKLKSELDQATAAIQASISSMEATEKAVKNGG